MSSKLVWIVGAFLATTLVAFGIWAYHPAPAGVIPFQYPESPEEGLHFVVTDTQSYTLAGTYREGDMWVAFEATRGEPTSLRDRIFEGGGPYETHGCFRSMFLQPIMTVDDCVIGNMSSTEDPDSDRAGRSYQFIQNAIIALKGAVTPGLEEELEFLIVQGSAMQRLTPTQNQ